MVHIKIMIYTQKKNEQLRIERKFLSILIFYYFWERILLHCELSLSHLFIIHAGSGELGNLVFQMFTIFKRCFNSLIRNRCFGSMKISPFIIVTCYPLPHSYAQKDIQKMFHDLLVLQVLQELFHKQKILLLHKAVNFQDNNQYPSFRNMANVSSFS